MQSLAEQNTTENIPSPTQKSYSCQEISVIVSSLFDLFFYIEFNSSYLGGNTLSKKNDHVLFLLPIYGSPMN